MSCQHTRETGVLALLIVIYISFISLGLPDTVLGSAWPSMYEDLGVPISYAGIPSMIVAGGTILSSLMSDRMIGKYGTGSVTFASVAMTAAALTGVSFSDSFFAICAWAVPLGLGAGSVDTALNNFVALHYRASHMNWLHSFWGIGASLGPLIIAFFLASKGSWKTGYLAISLIQFALVGLLFATLPLWKKARPTEESTIGSSRRESLGLPQLLRLPKAKPTLISFFCYCSLELTVGLWGSSYLVLTKGVAEDVAAGWISLYYVGITLGRLFSGFLAMRFSPRQLIRGGQGLIAAGLLCLIFPPPRGPLLAGLFLIGLGCAPIYPNLLHETPNTFSKEKSQAIMGMQMACAYVGTTFMPPLFGLLGARFGYGLLPFFSALLLLLMISMVTLVYREKGGRFRQR